MIKIKHLGAEGKAYLRMSMIRSCSPAKASDTPQFAFIGKVTMENPRHERVDVSSRLLLAHKWADRARPVVNTRQQSLHSKLENTIVRYSV